MDALNARMVGLLVNQCNVAQMTSNFASSWCYTHQEPLRCFASCNAFRSSGSDAKLLNGFALPYTSVRTYIPPVWGHKIPFKITHPPIPRPPPHTHIHMDNIKPWRKKKETKSVVLNLHNCLRSSRRPADFSVPRGSCLFSSSISHGSVGGCVPAQCPYNNVCPYSDCWFPMNTMEHRGWLFGYRLLQIVSLKSLKTCHEKTYFS